MTETRMNRRESPMNPNEPPKENTTGLLRLFVYGTLKRGYWNHGRFCRGVLSVEEAVVRGRLYELPSGIPVLEVPEADVLAHGTADPLTDVAAQARLAAEFAAPVCVADATGRRAAPPELGENGAPGGRWGAVYGELLTFDDPETRLPAIDHLEGFLPGGLCLYERVLVPVGIERGMFPAWLYHGGARQWHAMRYLPTGIWMD